jgi:hypothetical protein
MQSDRGAKRLTDKRAGRIRRKEVALVGDVVDIDVEPPVLGVVTKR